MPSEPVEAEFASPPVLTRAQEEEYRQLEREGPLTPYSSTQAPTPTYAGTSPDLTELEQTHAKDGYLIVSFDKGKGEDPREWDKGRKW